MARTRTLHAFLFALCSVLNLLAALPAARADASLGFTVAHAFSIPADPVTNPTGGLTAGAEGFLYGLAYNVGGGSALFKIRPDGTGLTELHKYQSSNVSDGNVFPAGTLTLGRDGFFYGFSYRGSADDTGALCKISADGSTFQILHTFSPQLDNVPTAPNSDGANPAGSLTQGGDGALYGATQGGGPGGRGTLFKVGADGTGFTVLHAFSAASGGHGPNADGATPTGALVSAPDGFLYGTTFRGGANGWGTVFRAAPDGTVFQPLYAFNKGDSGSAAGLILGSDGFLYGTTLNTAFKLRGDGTGFQTLHTFRDPNAQPPASEGALLQAALVQGPDGTLYGVTEDGGINGTGTIFQINTDGAGYQSLHSFDAYGSNTDGANPVNALVQGADGSFYGTSRNGGTSANGTTYGTLFRLTPATGHTHLLWNNADGKVSLWTVDSRGSHADTAYGPYVEGPNSAWSAKDLAVGPDGLVHILWNNTDGRTSLWNVNPDGSHSTLGTYGPFMEGPGSAWSATALSIGPDNVPHILWNNTDKRVSLWNVRPDGSFVTLGTYGPFVEGPGSIWSATALSVGPDNVPHVLWNNTDRRVSLWNVQPDGGFVTVGTYGPFVEGPGSVWSAKSLSIGPDGVPHVLWSNTDRRASLWNVRPDGGFATVGTYGPYVEGPGSIWSALGLSVGPDGVPHILWTNTDTRASLWNVDVLGRFITLGTYGPFTDGVPPMPWAVTAVAGGP